MENQVNLFLISTALQIINANEAKAKFAISNQSAVLIVAAYSHNLVTIKKVIDYSQWKEVRYVNDDIDFIKNHEENIKNRKYISAFIVVISNLRKSLKIVSQYDRVEKLFVGNYANIDMLNLINHISYKSLILLDDGIGTIEVNERRKKNINYLKDFSGKLDMKAMVKKCLLGYRIYHPNNVCFFTIYDLKMRKGDTRVVNDFSETKKMINRKGHLNAVYFVGGPYSELHPILLTESNYFKYLIEIKTYFKDMDFIYIPHKAESSEKINKIKNYLNITVQPIDLPVELSLIGLPRFPLRLSGFVSSALVNCKLIFEKELTIVSIKINKRKIVNTDAWEDINKVYSYYATIADDNFRIVELCD